MRRASKRLINAIIALVVSVIMCIGVCLAWFAMNDNVSGNGMQTQVKGSDIISFNVNASYLNFNESIKTEYVKAGTGSVTINGLLEEFDRNGNGVLNVSSTDGNDEMRSYDPSDSYASAVLFTVDYEILAGSDKTFRIYATCPYITEHEHLTENVFSVVKSTVEEETDIYYSSLSNAVFLSEASYDDTNDKYTVKSSSETEAYNVKFIKEDYTKKFTKDLKTGIENTSDEENLENTVYFIMDYDEALFNSLTNLMLTSGGTLSSKLKLYGDVIFGIEECDTVETEPTVEDVTFVSSTSVTTQTVGSDTMSSTWEFLLTYSDDTLETVKYSASEFGDISGLDTSVTGNGTATVTYSDIIVEIPYTIKEPTAVTGIKLNTTSKTVTIGDTFTITATVSPSDAANKTVLWQSSDTNVATVDSDGVVKAVGKGTATITAKSAANSEITATCEVTVNAQTFTVTFSSNGKTASNMPASQSVESGGTVTAPTTTPTATGYTFDGWYKDSDCTTVFDFDTETISSNTTIYAKWTATSYTITYMDGDTVLTGLEPTTYTIETTTALPTPTKDGYTFIGWYTAKTDGTQVTSLTGKTENLTLYAQWTENSGSSGETVIEKATASSFPTGSISKGTTFYEGTSFSITLVGGSAELSYDGTKATADDGESFDQALLPGGSGRSYEITASKNVKLKIYLTITDGSWAGKTGNITLNASAVSELSFTSNTDTSKAYCLEIELAAGETATISSSANRLALYGVYGEYTE